MSINIEAVVQRGYERTVTRTGVLFATILFVISLLDAMFSAPIEQRVVPLDEIGSSEIAPVSDPVAGAPPISLGLSPTIAGGLSLVLGIVSLVVTIAAIRTFVGDETQTLPREHFTEDILWPALNLVVGNIVFGIAVAVGFVLLVVPGLFLLVSLLFWVVFVAVENDNFLEGFRHSWDLTRSRRLRLFLLGVVVLVVVAIVSIAFAVPSIFLPTVISFMIDQGGSALVTVFSLAAFAETYNQLVTIASEERMDPAID